MNEAAILQFFGHDVLELFSSGFPEAWHEILFHRVRSTRTASIDRPPYNASDMTVEAKALKLGNHTGLYTVPPRPDTAE
jgi:hypothetical protein